MEFERCSRWDVTKTIVRVGGARLGRYGTYLPVGRLFSNHHHNGCEGL
jgi:hypothetical protein